MFESTAYALGASGGAAGQQGSGGFSGIIMMLVIFGIFYFILIRPQQKKMKEHKKLIEGLKKDDRIVTAGGVYGIVKNTAPNTLTVEIADGVRVKISRSSVGTVLTEEEASKE
jgi:preprotein translocase subunit YajC